MASGLYAERSRHGPTQQRLALRKAPFHILALWNRSLRLNLSIKLLLRHFTRQDRLLLFTA